MDADVTIALIVASEAIVVAIVYTLVRGDRRRTHAEAGKLTDEGDASIVGASATMMGAAGEWGVRLMARVQQLEDDLRKEQADRRAERETYEGRIRDLEAQVAALKLTLASRDESQQQVGIMQARLEAAEEGREHWRAKARRWADLLAENGIDVPDGPGEGLAAERPALGLSDADEWHPWK